MTTSKRITIDLPEIPEWFLRYVTTICNNVVHTALDEFGSPAVCTIVPLEQEVPNVEVQEG